MEAPRLHFPHWAPAKVLIRIHDLRIISSRRGVTRNISTFRSIQRQLYLKSAPARGITYRNCSTVQFNEFFHNGKPQACTPRSLLTFLA